MLDPIIVDATTFYPHKCGRCGANKAPFLDWHVEIPGYGRLYTCAYCDQKAAVVRGFVKGEKADEIAASAALLEAKEREVTSLIEQLGNATAESEILQLAVRERDEKIGDLEARVSQMSATIRESAEAAQAHLALVGSAPLDVDAQPRDIPSRKL